MLAHTPNNKDAMIRTQAMLYIIARGILSEICKVTSYTLGICCKINEMKLNENKVEIIIVIDNILSLFISKYNFHIFNSLNEYFCLIHSLKYSNFSILLFLAAGNSL